MDLLSENINIKHIHFQNKVYGKEEIVTAVNDLSKHLKKNYISDSPFVLLSTYNHIKTLIAFYAILRSGKIAVIINPEIKTIELTEIINETDPAAFILVNTFGSEFKYDEEIIFRTKSPHFIVVSNLEHVVVMMYSNAEDGKAKAAMITDYNLLSAMHTFIEVERITTEKCICALLPYYHLFGLTYGLILPCYVGCSALISDLNMLRINELSLSLKKAGVTNIFSVPSLYYLLSRVQGIDKILENANDFISGGIKLSPVIYDTFYKKTGKKLREGYGLTESSPGVTLTLQNSEVNLDSVGQVLPNCDIRIFDDTGKECKTNTAGEICIKGEIVFRAYFNNPKSTERVVKEGWLHTGDLGSKNSKGYIQFKGLKKNMYNVAGNNVYPKELERLLKMNQQVHHVNIFKEHSELQGDIVGADVELNSPSDNNIKSFKEWCNKNITNFKLPRVLNFVK